MRPPECDVCGERAARDGLIDCLPTEAGVAFSVRAQQPGFVGHPPDTGWFCAAHAPRARELAATHHLGDVIGQLRAADAPPDRPDQPQPARETTQDFPWAGSLHDLHRALNDALPTVLEHVGLAGTEIEERTKRSWHPMDGSRPPDCPFVETTVREVRDGDLWVCLEKEVAHWNENTAARASVRLDVVRAGERQLLVSAWSPVSGAPHDVLETRLSGDMPPGLAEVLAAGGALN